MSYKSKAEKAIQQFEGAVREHAFIGSKPPNERQYYNDLLALTKLRLRMLVGTAAQSRENMTKLTRLTRKVLEWTPET